MLTPSSEIIQLLATFAVAMSAPTFANALVLIYGTLLAPGRRTVASALRVMGCSEEANPSKYHRVFSRARWSPMHLSRLLLGLLVDTFVPEGVALVLLVDETLERRAGKKIGYKGWFRDAVRSVGNKVAVSLGIRGCCVCLLVWVPWSSRPWALPVIFRTILVQTFRPSRSIHFRPRSSTPRDSGHVQVGFFPTICWEGCRATKEKGHLAHPTTLAAPARPTLRAPDPPGYRARSGHHPPLQAVGQRAPSAAERNPSLQRAASKPAR